jgi:TolB protein
LKVKLAIAASAAALLASGPAAPQGRPLTAVRDSYPNLSPDGTRLLFQSNRGGRQAIWTAGADGGDPRLLFDGGGLGERPATPVWSPDGRTIAFAMAPAGAADPEESEIYVMRPDGTEVRRLTAAPGDDSHPHWSADGRRLYFNSARATPDLKAEWSRQWIDIYSIAADGSDLRRHTDCRAVCTYPVPSPDGRRIVHRRIVAGPGLDWALKPIARNSEVFVTPLDGSAGVNVSRSPAFDGWPTWAPGGKWLVFASNRDGPAATGQIYAVRPDGTGLHALTRGGWSRVQPSFAGPSRMLVYQGREEGETEIGHVAELPVALAD